MKVIEAERSVNPRYSDMANVYIRAAFDSGDRVTVHVTEQEARDVFGLSEDDWA